MLPVPFRHVTIDDTFWAPRIQRNRESTLPFIYQNLQETGRIDALRLTWKPGDEPMPHIFWDSDIGKWIEAASNSLATTPDPALKQQVDDVIDLLAQGQHADGYLNTYFTVVAPGKRWTNLRDLHELYCAGHLIEGAVAHYQATGERKLLDIMCRYVDFIAQTFGKQSGQKPGYDGHEEIELALIKLYHATNDARYLELSRYFVDERGRQPHYFDNEARERGEDPQAFEMGTYEYNQSHLPVLEQTQVVGHAVRAMYLNSALADLAREQDDERLFAACRRLWDHLTTTRMYLTGGIGTSARNEGFTRDYDLPNETAYAETCAAIGLVFWAHRMLQLDCNRAYADVMELALYNRVLSGVSLSGDRFFYEDPLASDGTVHRQYWPDV
ncbi:MAG TPA: beta-L-arabinofuranosidase domain-containing protein, partial [Ktedonobacterales bacterium]|nr:beta-L-arabinofuranosidase domain-containing protein [Ktedonobacterales bacterium]